MHAVLGVVHWVAPKIPEATNIELAITVLDFAVVRSVISTVKLQEKHKPRTSGKRYCRLILQIKGNRSPHLLSLLRLTFVTSVLKSVLAASL